MIEIYFVVGGEVDVSLVMVKSKWKELEVGDGREGKMVNCGEIDDMYKCKGVIMIMRWSL